MVDVGAMMAVKRFTALSRVKQPHHSAMPHACPRPSIKAGNNSIHKAEYVTAVTGTVAGFSILSPHPATLPPRCCWCNIWIRTNM